MIIIIIIIIITIKMMAKWDVFIYYQNVYLITNMHNWCFFFFLNH